MSWECFALTFVSAGSVNSNSNNIMINQPLSCCRRYSGEVKIGNISLICDGVGATKILPLLTIELSTTCVNHYNTVLGDISVSPLPGQDVLHQEVSVRVSLHSLLNINLDSGSSESGERNVCSVPPVSAEVCRSISVSSCMLCSGDVSRLVIVIIKLTGHSLQHLELSCCWPLNGVVADRMGQI